MKPYKPTQEDLEQMGFIKVSDYWYSLTKKSLSDYPFTIYFGTDAYNTSWVLILRDAGNNECEHHLYPKSLSDIQSLIELLNQKRDVRTKENTAETSDQ